MKIEKMVLPSRIEGQCDSCGKKLRVKAPWGYGSPIVVCGGCGKEFFLDGVREPAVEGLLPVTSDAGYHLKFILVMLAMSLLAAIPSLVDRGIYIMSSLLSIVCLLMAVYEVGMFLWVALGGARKANERYMRESEERLKNPEYVQKLLDYGYIAPSKYRMMLPEEKDRDAEE